MPVEYFQWAVQHLSKEGDLVLDINSPSGYGMVASLFEGRHSVWVSTEQSYHTCKQTLAEILSAETAQSDDDEEEEEEEDEDVREG